MGKLKFIGDAVEGGLNAIRSAGRAAHEQQAAVRAARDAEVAEQMANLPARNKKANEALGLYHPVGGGIKLSKPTRGMHSTTVADPKFKPPKINDITPEQLVKEEAALFPLVGDRAAGGKYLTHVGENELEAPVRLTGGPLYMDANYNHLIPDDSAAWESGLGRVTALGRQAERAGEGGRPVYGIYTAGSGTNTDFNIMGANALIQQIPFSKITKKAEKEFDQAMRAGSEMFAAIPNWPGIRSPQAQAMLLDKSNGIARTKLFDTMGKENFQSMGFPDVPATRKAIIEPELLDIPTNQAGFRMARMDTKGRIIEDPNIPSDYPAAMAGKVAGKLDVPADYKDVFQTHFDARRLLSKPESGDYYSFSRAHPIQYADDAWLNRLMEQRFANERKIKEGGYKKGGAVEDFDAKVDKLIENHHFDNHVNSRIEQHFAKGGMPKLARTTLRMGKGGLLSKGAKALAGAIKEAQVMPAVEREANLAKFLEPSKAPMRLYHGTTATEGGKGTEAIRRLKPSKEGALGSGIYTTPNTAHASSYTGIPNDEALEMMRLGGDYSKKMADQFAADRVTGRLREGQAGGNMLPVHVQMRNPLIIGKSGRNIDPAADALMSLGMDEASAVKLVEKAFEEKGNIGKQIQSRAQAQGYDGIMQYRGDNLSEVVSYNPNAVKSAIGNQGTYDINLPDLSKAKGGVILKHKTLRNRGATQSQPNGFKDGGKGEATVQATPRSKGYGAASDLLKEVHEFASKPFGYSNPPVEFISELLGIPAASRVLDKLSYGEPITNYGKANVPLIPDDTFDAFTAGLGGLGSMSKLAKPLAKGLKMLPKNLPVGMSIKPVGDIPTGAPKLTVKPPSDNVANVRDANFQYPKTVGNQTVDINKLSGGVRMSDPKEVKRVKALADQMSGPEGYISRIIVDHNNNVIEGQHRLEALRQLGVKDVPVFKIEDLADTMPVSKMEEAMREAGGIHSDHVNQLMKHALDDISEGGIEGARQLDYGKFQKHYDAALDAVSGMRPVLPAAKREANLANMLEGSAVKNQLYHGTGRDIQKFDKSKLRRTAFGEGFHLAESPNLANFYANQFDEAQNVMPVYAAIKKPYELKSMHDWYDIPGANDTEKTNLLKSQGYDGVKYPHGAGGDSTSPSPNVYVAFEPEQIKSATGNRGTYDITDADISKAKGGAILKHHTLRNRRANQRVR